MNLKQFATKAGVSIVECDPSYGGRFGFRCVDAPNATWCGYKSEAAAYKGWLIGTFGEQTSKAVAALLKQTEARKRK